MSFNWFQINMSDFKKIMGRTDFCDQFRKTSSPKGNDAHLSALGSRYYACP